MVGTLSFISFFVYAFLQIPVAIWAEQYSLKYILLISIGIITAGLFIYISAHTFMPLALGRTLIAIGSAFAFIGSAAVSIQWFSEKEFPFVFGLMQGISNLSVVVFMLIMPIFIINKQSWRPVGLTLALTTIVIFILALFFFRQAKQSKNRSAIFTSLLNVLSNKQVWVASAFGGLLMGSLVGFGANWNIIYQKTYAHTLYGASIINSAIFLGFAIGNPIVGWLSERWGSTKKLILYFTTATFLLFTIIVLAHKLAFLLIVIIMFVFGFSASVSILAFTIVITILPPAERNIGVGLCNTIINISIAVISFLVGMVIDAVTVHTTAHLFAERIALSLFLFAILESFVFALFIEEPKNNAHLD